MAIQKDIVINRKEYQGIKKKDHNQMNLYLQNIYKMPTWTVLRPVRSLCRG